MATEKESPAEKKFYSAPTIITHGDIEGITLGVDLGEDLDAAFTTSAISSSSSKGRKKPKKHQPTFS
jgi:hypothetical protein